MKPLSIINQPTKHKASTDLKKKLAPYSANLFQTQLPEMRNKYQLHRFIYTTNPLRKIFLLFLQTLSNLNVVLTEKDIKKIYNLPLYGKREITRDLLVFLYYHKIVKSYQKIKDNNLLIKSKNLSKIEKEILQKYQYKIPIIDPKTILSYLPDLLILAEIPVPIKPLQGRNTFANLLIDTSFPPEMLFKRATGHRNIGATIENYNRSKQIN